MAENVENQTLHMLREMREENREFRMEVREQFASVNDRLDDHQVSLNALTHMVRMLYASHHDHEERIQRLEGVEQPT